MAIVPVTDDLDTGGWFQAAADGKLTVRQCSDCQTVLHLPRAYCHTCGSFDGHWREVTPSGSIYSFSVVTHQVHPEFPVPYTLILIELDDIASVRFVGHLDGRPEITIGQRVEARFTHLADDAALPTWRLIGVS